MPARRRLLPRPCPCGKENGTVQLIIFDHKYHSSRHTVICRIKHYYPEFYKLSKEKQQERNRGIRITTTGSTKISYKARWCSFCTRHMIELCNNTGRKIPLREYFDIYTDDPFKSKTFTPDESFYKVVKESGWGIEEDSKWRHGYWVDYLKKYGHDALPEDLLSHEENISEYERLKYSKHRRWGLLPDIVAAERASKLFESKLHPYSKDFSGEHM